MIVTSALIIWKALMCITGSESPVVVVLSGSMEPGFKRVSQSNVWKLQLSLSFVKLLLQAQRKTAYPYDVIKKRREEIFLFLPSSCFHL
jgi:signal peptidase I